MNEIRDLLQPPVQGRRKESIYEVFAYFLTQEVVFNRTDPITRSELVKNTRLGDSTAHQTLELITERGYTDRHELGTTRAFGREAPKFGFTLTESGREMGIVVVSFAHVSPQYQRILLHEGVQFPSIHSESQAE